MPVHDWTRVDAGIFHAFHLGWLAHISEALNGGLLPDGFYALAEQHAGRTIPDVLTLNAGPLRGDVPRQDIATGGTAVAEAPPRMRHHESLEPPRKGTRRTIAIRHVSGHRLVALFELVSPANKDRQKNIDAFVDKVADALGADVHVCVVDLFPPGPNDPHGMTAAIRERLVGYDDPFELPDAQPLTLASYVAGSVVEVYLECLAVGDMLPEMPLFLSQERYVNLPLESTYGAAYQGMPAYWREVLEGNSAH